MQTLDRSLRHGLRHGESMRVISLGLFEKSHFSEDFKEGKILRERILSTELVQRLTRGHLLVFKD